jgi:exodeoxyribonuclease-3
VKIITWNVNSVRQRLARLLALLERHDPDVVCLQETKVEDEAFPTLELDAAGYESVSFGQRAYNGVAILSRSPVVDVRRGFPGDPLPDEARVLGGTVDDLRVLNLYVVNGKAVGTPTYDRKLAWLDALTGWLRGTHDPRDPLLVVGDFNIAPEEEDVHDPERWADTIHFTDPERQRVRAMLDWGLVDLLRLSHEGPGPFTWWDYRFGAFHRGWGLRLDLALGTHPVADRCAGVLVDRDERKPTFGEGKPSDHAPVIVTLDRPRATP